MKKAAAILEQAPASIQSKGQILNKNIGSDKINLKKAE